MSYLYLLIQAVKNSEIACDKAYLDGIRHALDQYETYNLVFDFKGIVNAAEAYLYLIDFTESDFTKSDFTGDFELSLRAILNELIKTTTSESCSTQT